jgi:hypothetical protein
MQISFLITFGRIATKTRWGSPPDDAVWLVDSERPMLWNELTGAVGPVSGSDSKYQLGQKSLELSFYIIESRGR